MTPDTASSAFGTDRSTFDTLFTVAAVFIGLVFVLVIVLVVRNVIKARRHGLDPTTLGTDLTARLMAAQVLAPQTSLETRLAELDKLRESQQITPEEHARARQAILEQREE